MARAERPSPFLLFSNETRADTDWGKRQTDSGQVVGNSQANTETELLENYAPSPGSLLLLSVVRQTAVFAKKMLVVQMFGDGAGLRVGSHGVGRERGYLLDHDRDVCCFGRRDPQQKGAWPATRTPGMCCGSSLAKRRTMA